LPKLERLVKLAQLAREQGTLTVREMSEVCGISQRTVYRYLKTLRRFDLPNDITCGERRSVRRVSAKEDRVILTFVDACRSGENLSVRLRNSGRDRILQPRAIKIRRGGVWLYFGLPGRKRRVAYDLTSIAALKVGGELPGCVQCHAEDRTRFKKG